MEKSDFDGIFRRDEDVHRIYRNAIKDVEKVEPQRTIEIIRLQAWRDVKLDRAYDNLSEIDLGLRIQEKQNSMFLELMFAKVRTIELRHNAIIILLAAILATLWFR